MQYLYSVMLKSSMVVDSKPNSLDFFLDLSKIQVPTFQTNQIILGTTQSISNEELNTNDKHLTKNGQPWFPIMGEFHFSRYSRYWMGGCDPQNESGWD